MALAEQMMKSGQLSGMTPQQQQQVSADDDYIELFNLSTYSTVFE